MLQGYVDSISPDKRTLKGWVQLGNSGAVPTLWLDHQGWEEGSVTFGPERADVVATRGLENRSFTLTLENAVEVPLLLVKAHQVIAYADGIHSAIPLGGTAHKDMLRQFVRTLASVKGNRDTIIEALGMDEATGSRAGTKSSIDPHPASST